MNVAIVRLLCYQHVATYVAFKKKTKSKSKNWISSRKRYGLKLISATGHVDSVFLKAGGRSGLASQTVKYLAPLSCFPFNSNHMHLKCHLNYQPQTSDDIKILEHFSFDPKPLSIPPDPLLVPAFASLSTASRPLLIGMELIRTTVHK